MNKPEVSTLPLLTVERSESTNTDLLKDPRFEAPDALALRAIEQSAGRGRQGRTWVATPDALSFSIRWPFKKAPHELSGLSLVVALGLSEILEALGYPGIAIKWPNDLYADGQKFGGILVELGARTHVIPAVIGIGLNVREAPHGLDQATTALWAFGPNISPQDLYQQLVESLIPYLKRFEEEGFEIFKTDWEGRALWINKTVRSGHLTGRFLGVDREGAARIDSADGEIRLFSGDVSLRPDGDRTP